MSSCKSSLKKIIVHFNTLKNNTSTSLNYDSFWLLPEFGIFTSRTESTFFVDIHILIIRGFNVYSMRPFPMPHEHDEGIIGTIVIFSFTEGQQLFMYVLRKYFNYSYLVKGELTKFFT